MKSSVYIKNMVCDRCVMVVEQIFNQTAIATGGITLGEVKLSGEQPSPAQLEQLDKQLILNGFERIDDKKSKLLERVKTLIIDTIHHHDSFEMTINWSHYISGKMDYDYSHLSSLFSEVTGITLEQYIIKQKIEKVKEYLFYDELSVKEIAYKLGYSSVAHLSSQFKKVTGLTPTAFKSARETNTRIALDNIR